MKKVDTKIENIWHTIEKQTNRNPTMQIMQCIEKDIITQMSVKICNLQQNGENGYNANAFIDSKETNPKEKEEQGATLSGSDERNKHQTKETKTFEEKNKHYTARVRIKMIKKEFITDTGSLIMISPPDEKIPYKTKS